MRSCADNEVFLIHEISAVTQEIGYTIETSSHLYFGTHSFTGWGLEPLSLPVQCTYGREQPTVRDIAKKYYCDPGQRNGGVFNREFIFAILGRSASADIQLVANRLRRL